MATARIPDSSLVKGGRGALLARHGSGRPDEGTVLTGARGSLVWDFEGRECIDCTSQSQSKNLGATDPRVMDDAIKQLRQIAPIRPWCSSLALSEVSAKLGAIASAGVGQVTYSLHGSKAVDRAEVRRRSRSEAEDILVLQDASHGRSLATMAASWPHPPNPSGRGSPLHAGANPEPVPAPHWAGPLHRRAALPGAASRHDPQGRRRRRRRAHGARAWTRRPSRRRSRARTTVGPSARHQRRGI